MSSTESTSFLVVTSHLVVPGLVRSGGPRCPSSPAALSVRIDVSTASRGDIHGSDVLRRCPVRPAPPLIPLPRRQRLSRGVCPRQRPPLSLAPPRPRPQRRTHTAVPRGQIHGGDILRGRIVALSTAVDPAPSSPAALSAETSPEAVPRRHVHGSAPFAAARGPVREDRPPPATRGLVRSYVPHSRAPWSHSLPRPCGLVCSDNPPAAVRAGTSTEARRSTTVPRPPASFAETASDRPPCPAVSSATTCHGRPADAVGVAVAGGMPRSFPAGSSTAEASLRSLANQAQWSPPAGHRGDGRRPYPPPGERPRQ